MRVDGGHDDSKKAANEAWIASFCAHRGRGVTGSTMVKFTTKFGSRTGIGGMAID
jgi:hypothetical protein